MLRKSAVTLAALAALNAAQVKALGLGDITVHSALNQPLNAEINLLQLRELSNSQIIAGLANADDFYLAGVKPTAILTDINFQLEVKNGKGVIRLTSREPIKEPFLNFLVEVNWPSGRLVREYTLLLDPPVFSAKDLMPRSAPVAPTATSVTARPSAQNAVAAAAPGGAGSNVQGQPAAGSQYFVDAHDTLWNVALKTRPDRSITPQQMMLAIQRTNPDAFINNNINRLKSGVVLNIPTKQQLLNVGFSESVQEVKRQNSAWKGASPKPEETAKKTEQLDARKSDTAPSAAAGDDDEAQLRIVSQTPESASSATEDNTISVDSEANLDQESVAEQLISKNQELEEQLVVTLEGLDKVERDNAELFQRLDRLSDQLESVQRLMLLKDQQLAELQNKLTEAQDAQPLAAAQASASADKGFVDMLMQSPALLGGALAALVALLLGLLFVAKKRKRGEDDEQAVERAMKVLEERENNAASSNNSDTSGGATTAAAQVATAGAVAAATLAASERAEAESLAEPVHDTAAEPADHQDVVSEPASAAAAAPAIGDEFDALLSDDLDEQLGDDLNMDLKIDEPVEEDPEMAEFTASLLNYDDYDLALAEDELNFAVEDKSRGDASASELETPDASSEPSVAELAPTAEPAVEESLSDDLERAIEAESDLDFILAETASEATDVEEGADEAALESSMADELDVLLAENSALQVPGEEPEEADELDFLLAESRPEKMAAEEKPLAENEPLTENAPLAEDAPLVQDEPSNELFATDDGDETSALDTVEHHQGEDELLLEEGALDELLNLAEAKGDENSLPQPDLSSDDELAPGQDFSIDGLDPDVGPSEDPSVSTRSSDSVVEPATAADSLEPELAVDFSGLALEDEDSAYLAGETGQQPAARSPAVQPSSAQSPANEPMVGAEDIDPEIIAEIDAEFEAATKAGKLDGLEISLDRVSDDELESELNLMLEQEDNELALEETTVADQDEELNFLNTGDELGTKLDLARAYIDMDDAEGARDILQEVLKGGDSQQVTEAQKLIESLG